MPANTGIPQKAGRQRAAAHGHQQNDEDHISRGGGKKLKPRGGRSFIGTGFNLRGVRIQCVFAPTRHVTG